MVRNRKAGKSKFGFKKSGLLPFELFLFNDRPLRVCIQFGFICLGRLFFISSVELMKYIFAAGNYVVVISAVRNNILFSEFNSSSSEFLEVYWQNLLRSEASSSFHY